MSAGQAFASIRTSSALEVISEIPPQSAKPTAMSPLDGYRRGIRFNKYLGSSRLLRP